MKKAKISIAVLLSLLFVLFAMGSGESTTDTTVDQGADTVETTEAIDTTLGDYSVEILESRLAKDYEGSDVVIIKYKFTNNADEPTAFFLTFDAAAYQNDIGLNECIFVDDSANYTADNQTKEIKKGASIEVEVAYELNDTTSDVVVEVKETFSFEEKTITKTFAIAE